ncbi:spore coat protein U-like protein [Variovorax beijingensis]|uniref:Spore coat protein U-like protein n=1 Tax=Variovorax beijingensis TaxID=2496117 RepID=A0A561C5E3_9BURK|nr:spore coat U domain-containing protein [Variovorax beijingensis]TWD86072.1 spore coat protein U-like protein [Variovorax beijingensis]
MRTDRHVPFVALKHGIRNMALAASVLAVAGTAQAGTGQNCNLVLCVTVIAGDLAFGNYAPLSALVTDSTSTIAIQARLIAGLLPTAVSYTIGLGPGAGTIAQRKMTSGANGLNYNLYTDAAHDTVWGASSISGSTSPITGNASHTVYGRIPANQTTVVPGIYADTIVVTVTF